MAINISRPMKVEVIEPPSSLPDGVRFINHESNVEPTSGTWLVVYPDLGIALGCSKDYAKSLILELPDNLKLTPEYIKSKVVDATYIKHDTYTVCNVLVENGAKLTGVSGVIHPEHDIPQYGFSAARTNSVNKLWELEGYHRLSMLTLAGINPNDSVERMEAADIQVITEEQACNYK